MILVDISHSTTSTIIGMLERWGVCQVPTKASAKKKENKKKARATKYGEYIAPT